MRYSIESKSHGISVSSKGYPCPLSVASFTRAIFSRPCSAAISERYNTALLWISHTEQLVQNVCPAENSAATLRALNQHTGIGTHSEDDI